MSWSMLFRCVVFCQKVDRSVCVSDQEIAWERLSSNLLTGEAKWGPVTQVPFLQQYVVRLSNWFEGKSLKRVGKSDKTITGWVEGSTTSEQYISFRSCDIIKRG